MVFYWMFRIFHKEGEYPTACEIVSAVMVLSYYGYNVSIDDFIDDYLPKRIFFC